MAGQVKHTKIFGGVVPDLKLMSVLARLPFRNTDSLIARSPTCCKDEGVELLDSTALLQPMLAGAGVLTGRAPTADQQKDLDFGYRMADAIAGARHRADHRRQASGGRRRRGDGGHRRSRSLAPATSPGRAAPS